MSCGRQVAILKLSVLLLWLFWSCHCQWLHIDVLLVAWRGKLATILMVSALWFDDLSMPPSHWFWITTDQLFVWHWNLIQPRRWTLPTYEAYMVGQKLTHNLQSNFDFKGRHKTFFVRKKSLISWIKVLNFLDCSLSHKINTQFEVLRNTSKMHHTMLLSPCQMAS